MKRPADLIELWPAVVALIAATGFAAFALSTTFSSRLTNRALDATWIRSTYLIMSRSEPDRCEVVGRRGASMNRSEAERSANRRDCRRAARGDGGPGNELWLIQSKRIGEGTELLVHANDVSDWSYPFLYTFVREREPDATLPSAEWTQLYVNRVYRGLFLRVALPFDLRKRDGGSGDLRELVTFAGDRVTVMDTRFRDVLTDRNWDEDVMELSPPSPMLAWLAARNTAGSATYLRSNLPDRPAEVLPLPISIPHLFEDFYASPMTTTEAPELHLTYEPRYDLADPAPLPATVDASLREGFRTYASGLVAALRTDARIRGSAPPESSEFTARSKAVADLGLSMAVTEGT